MHYYQFNIGDYAKSTKHLDPIEDLIYRRLLDIYYDTEKPISSDIKKTARLIGLKNNEKETQAILDEFFHLTKNGYIQKRAKKEIEHYAAKANTARVNGKKGGRPKKTQSVNLANPEITGLKAKQEPITNNQEPITNKDINTVNFSFEKTLISLGADKLILKDWLKVRKSKKAANTETALKGFLNKVDKSDYTLNEVIKICAEEGWKGFNQDWIKINNQIKTSGNIQACRDFINE